MTFGFFVGWIVFVLLLLVFRKLCSKFVDQLVAHLLNYKYQPLNHYCSILHKAFLLHISHYFMIMNDCLIKDYYLFIKLLNYRYQVKANFVSLFFNLKIQIWILFFRLDLNENFVKIVIYLLIYLMKNYKHFILVMFYTILTYLKLIKFLHLATIFD